MGDGRRSGRSVQAAQHDDDDDGLRAAKHFFDGNESKYELWEVKFLGYLRIQHLHQIILSPTDQNDDIDFVEKNATIFIELIQYLDDERLSLVIRNSQYNRRKA